MTYAWVDIAPGRRRFMKIGARQPDARSDAVSMPMVIRDAFDAPVQCMADGKFYESKRALSEAHRKAGVIELGTHKGPAFDRPQVDADARRRDIKKACDIAGVDPHTTIRP